MSPLFIVILAYKIPHAHSIVKSYLPLRYTYPLIISSNPPQHLFQHLLPPLPEAFGVEAKLGQAYIYAVS